MKKVIFSFVVALSLLLSPISCFASDSVNLSSEDLSQIIASMNQLENSESTQLNLLKKIKSGELMSVQLSYGGGFVALGTHIMKFDVANNSYRAYEL